MNVQVYVALTCFNNPPLRMESMHPLTFKEFPLSRINDVPFSQLGRYMLSLAWRVCTPFGVILQEPYTFRSLKMTYTRFPFLDCIKIG